VAEGKHLDGELTSGPEAGEAGKDHRAEEVQHGRGARSGGAQTSMITHWYGSSGGTPLGREPPTAGEPTTRGKPPVAAHAPEIDDIEFVAQ
jgi:hypothetical protein